jgi:hypothetical protein
MNATYNCAKLMSKRRAALDLNNVFYFLFSLIITLIIFIILF